MTNLPATLADAEIRLIEADALAYARREIAKWRTIGNPYSDDHLMTPEASRACMRHIYKNVALNNCHRMMDIIALASSEPEADEALRELIVEFGSRGEQLPTELAAYNMEVARRGPDWRFPKRRGQKAHHHLLRDIFIAMTIAALCDRFGLLPTGRS